MKNGVGISKYKPVDYERLQAIIDGKRLETDALGEKVNYSKTKIKTEIIDLFSNIKNCWIENWFNVKKKKVGLNNSISTL